MRIARLFFTGRSGASPPRSMETEGAAAAIQGVAPWLL